VFVVRSSPHPKFWFRHPGDIRHYGAALFTSNLFVGGVREPEYEKLDPGVSKELYRNFVESMFFVPCTPLHPHATLGIDVNEGLYFEDLEDYLCKAFPSNANVSIFNETVPAEFFEVALAELIRNCQTFTYIDQYLFDHLYRGNRTLLELVMKVNSNVDIRLFSGTKNFDIPRSEKVKSSLQDIQSSNDHTGELFLEFADWNHNRYIILGFANDKRILIEFPVSLEYWDKPKFDVYKRVLFERYTGNTQNQIDPFEISTGRKKSKFVKATIRL